MADELIKVPDIGGAEGAEVVEVLVSPGDAIDVRAELGGGRIRQGLHGNSRAHRGGRQ